MQDCGRSARHAVEDPLSPEIPETPSVKPTIREIQQKAIFIAMIVHRHKQTAIWLLFFACLIIAFPEQASGSGSAEPSLSLPGEMQRLKISGGFVATGTKEAGVIQTVIGRVVVTDEGMTRGYYAAAGDRVFEKSVIHTLKGSKCRFRLVGADVVTLGENTRIGIKSFRQNLQKGAKSSVFTMLRGRAMFYALRLFRHTNSSMVVETPTAVSGVRGTKWGVEVTELAERESASRTVQLADNSGMGPGLLAQADPPPQFRTTILCFSGTVFAGSSEIPPGATAPSVTLQQGQMTTVGMQGPPSTPVLIPGSLAGAFIMETSVPPPGGASGSPPSSPPPPGAYQPLSPPLPPPDTSSLVQQQNSYSQTRPAGHWGYYYNDYVEVKPDLSVLNQGALWTDYPPANLDEKQVWSDKVWYPPTHAASKIELGYNAYAEWGYWAVAPWTYFDPVNGNITVYEHIGYIQGDLATAAQISALKASGVVGNYTGTAFGVHRTNSNAGMPLMQGTFSATINFATSAVSDFNISVSGSGRSAGITGATGSLSSAGNFQVSGAGFVSGNSPGTGTAYGSVYGSSGQAVGGSWVVQNPPYSTWAGGIFQGRR